MSSNEAFKLVCAELPKSLIKSFKLTDSLTLKLSTGILPIFTVSFMRFEAGRMIKSVKA